MSSFVVQNQRSTERSIGGGKTNVGNHKYTISTYVCDYAVLGFSVVDVKILFHLYDAMRFQKPVQFLRRG